MNFHKLPIKKFHMIQKFPQCIFISLLAIVITGCTSSKEIIYFQDTEGQQIQETLVNYEPTIQYGDIVSINVSALDAEAAIPFNNYETSITSIGISNTSIPTYIVNADGEIDFPVLKKIRAAELTIEQLTSKLEEALAIYIKDPFVKVRLTNFKVTVLGEVRAPGSFPVLNERITIFEAIGLAGDLTIKGKRNAVTLLREKDGKRAFIPIDLTSKQLVNSPYYYLAQNDVLYVEPNKSKINSSSIGPTTSIIMGAIGIMLSVISIVIR